MRISPLDIRKTVTVIEDILIEDGKPLPRPVRRTAFIAVVGNPLVRRTDDDLSELNRDGEDLGRFLAKRALEVVDAGQIESIGKGVIVGMNGQPEHGQAVLYPRFAAAARETLRIADVPVLSERLIGAPGSALRVPLQRLDGGGEVAPKGVMELRVPGSPAAEEILVALVVTGVSSARPS